MTQEYLSGETCINGRQGKMPAAFSKLTFEQGQKVFDYGCGEVYDLPKAKVEESGATYIAYDIVWHPETISELHDIDISICSNVLNVIKEESIIIDIINKLVTNSKQVVFSIHPGSGVDAGNNIGRETTDRKGNVSWQRYNSRKWYEELIKSLGYTITKATGNIIYVKGGN